MTLKPPRRMYYTISQAAEMAGVKPSVLRFWETQFDCLRPRKNRAGNRVYRPEDLKWVLLIRRLLHEEGFTIAGARRRIARATESPGERGWCDERATEEVLAGLRKELAELLEVLE